MTDESAGKISLESQESDGHEGREQESEAGVRLKLGVKDYLALFVALLETIAIPLLVVMAVLFITVLFAFR